MLLLLTLSLASRPASIGRLRPKVGPRLLLLGSMTQPLRLLLLVRIQAETMQLRTTTRPMTMPLLRTTTTRLLLLPMVRGQRWWQPLSSSLTSTPTYYIAHNHEDTPVESVLRTFELAEAQADPPDTTQAGNTTLFRTYFDANALHTIYFCPHGLQGCGYCGHGPLHVHPWNPAERWSPCLLAGR